VLRAWISAGVGHGFVAPVAVHPVHVPWVLALFGVGVVLLLGVSVIVARWERDR
jgi:hypothetical protein